MNKVMRTYFISTYIDAQFQVIIYLLFFEIAGATSLAYVFLSKYILKNILYENYERYFKKIKLRSLYLFNCLFFVMILKTSGLLPMVVSTSGISIILALINIRVKVSVQKSSDKYVASYSKMSLIASCSYLLGTLTVVVCNSNIEVLSILLILISIVGAVWSPSLKVVPQNECNDKKYKTQFDIPIIFFAILVTVILSVSIDNYELAFITSLGYDENFYSIVVFLSGFFYIVASGVMSKQKGESIDSLRYGILGCVVALLGYLMFTLSYNMALIVLSMGVIAIGYIMYSTLLNVYIAERFGELSERYFVSYSRIENIILSIIFVVSGLAVEKMQVYEYYKVLDIILVIYIIILGGFLAKRKVDNGRNCDKS